MARKIADTKKMTHEEWLARRTSSLGGTDAAAIVGLSPWSSQITVYAQKKGLVKPKESSEAMRLGTDLEAYVAERFVEKTGKKVRNDFFMYADDEYDFITANIDRRVVGENAGLECKTMGTFAGYDIEGGEVPSQYYAQCQHYMMIMGWDKVYLAVLVLQRGFYVVDIGRNDSFIADMRKAEVEFWREYIEKDEMPAPDGSDAAGETLKELYPRSKEGLQAVVPGLDRLISDYRAASDMEKQYKERKQALQEQICSKLGAAEGATGNNFACSWKSQKKSSFDSKRFRAEHPDIYSKYTTESSYRVFRTKAIS